MCIQTSTAILYELKESRPVENSDPCGRARNGCGIEQYIVHSQSRIDNP